MKPYNFRFYEEPDYKGKIHYSIEILPPSWKEVGKRYVKKEYTDEWSYRQDIEQDFMNLSPDGNAMLSDERAQYYGWIETPAA